MKLNCIVVDDSFIQKLSVKKLVESHSDLLLTGDFDNVMDAKKHLKAHPVDVIFLDIEMPVLTGFDLLDSLEDLPQIIFITGKTEYAFKAFNYDATDYLQKPVTIEKFNRAVGRAIAVKKIRDQKNSGGNEEYIFVKANSKNVKIFLQEIKYVEAMGDYIKIVTDLASYMVLSTMKNMEKMLPTTHFLRVHKSFIINTFRIDGYDSKNIMLAGVSIPLSRAKKAELEAITEQNQ